MPQRLTKKQAAAKKQREQLRNATEARATKELKAARSTGLTPRSYLEDRKPVPIPHAMPDLTYDPTRSPHQHSSMLQRTPPSQYKPRAWVQNESMLTEEQLAEFAERERLAQEQLEIKKDRVMPLFNKGGLQYRSETDDPKTFGRRPS